MLRKRILVVGSGQSGLMLATGLHRRGWTVDLFTRGSTDELRGGPPAPTQHTFPSVWETERAAGLDLWSGQAPTFTSVQMTMVPDGAAPQSFAGHLSSPGTAIDHRVKTADWLEAFEDQGGNVHVKSVTSTDVEGFARLGMWDVIVLAVGGGGELGHLFDPDPDHSSGASSRVLSQVYVYGAAPGAADLQVWTTPYGEVFSIPVLTAEGPATSVQVIARPGGPMDSGLADGRRPAAARRSDVRPRITEHISNVLRTWAPDLEQRCARADYHPGSALVCAVDPVVRRPLTHIRGVPVLGIGDAVLRVDPTSGQGAAASTLVAATVRDRILGQAAEPVPVFDADFLTDTYEQYWQAHGRHTAAFSTMVTDFWAGTLPPAVLKTFAAAGTDQTIADWWVNGFDNPAALADALLA